MDSSPASQGRRASTIVERKLDELSSSLEVALSPSGPRSPVEERLLVKDIKKKMYFLGYLIVAEGESHGGAPPVYLAEAEARFSVLRTAFDRWERRVVAIASPNTDKEEGGSSGSECSCTGSCQEAAVAGDAEVEAVETLVDVTPDAATDNTCDSVVTREEVTPPNAVAEKKRDSEQKAVVDAEIDFYRVAWEPSMLKVTPDGTDKKRDSVVAREEVAPTGAVAIAKKKRCTEHEAVVPLPREEAKPDDSAKKRDAEHQGAAGTKRSTAHQRWWSRGAAWCGAAGVVAVVAVGLAVELAALARDNVGVYVVPT